LTMIDATPIINKNTSKFRSTNLVKGNSNTSNKININPVIIMPPILLITIILRKQSIIYDSDHKKFIVMEAMPVLIQNKKTYGQKNILRSSFACSFKR